ncbi:hypothetical protein [Gallaecimonas mangrovi]|uniref:hypothetical protein n=1 Tax=Gallaecimonas mangrovi TaxID=2291597 RepID=UPI000E20BBD4|nr:hypothetical protein [Gallaecimonas mangrovi]
MPHTNKMKRPSFNSNKKRAARLEASLATGIDYTSVNLRSADLAAPHRAPYAAIRDMVLNGSRHEIRGIVKPLVRASRRVRHAFKRVSQASNARDYHRLANMYRVGEMAARRAYRDFRRDPNNPAVRKALVVSLNNLPSNAPGLGPHNTTNNPVSDRLHLHPTEQLNEPLSPRSRAARRAFPQEEVATTSSGHLVSVTGSTSAPFPAISNPQSTVNIPSNAPQLRGSLFVTRAGEVMKPHGSSGWKKVT